MLRKLCVFFLATFPYFCFLHASTVRVINDSPFPLGVTVLSATGAVMGRETLQPTQQYGWETFDVSVDKQSQTPYTVVFYCQNGGIFGTVANVTTGSMVMASTATGSRYCTPKDDKKGKEEQKKSDLQYQPKPINPEQWRDQQRY
jgi:hypothetical protein